MSACARPAIQTTTLADHFVARCITCWSVSPPGEREAEDWAQAHRGNAVATNTAIDRAVRA